MKPFKISFCTTCMNRLSHIQTTLPKNIFDNQNYKHLEFVLVDYNSTDGLEEYVKKELYIYIESGKLVYYRTDEPQRYRMSHSRNLAFKLATGDIVCNIDADNFTGEKFAEYVNEQFQKNDDIYLSTQHGEHRVDNDVLGRICVKKSDFIKVGGYDEKMLYYGFDDFDFAYRLEGIGIKRQKIEDPKFLRAIKHSDSLRMTNSLGTDELEALYMNYVSPAESKLLFLFKNGNYALGTILQSHIIHLFDSNYLPLEPDTHKYIIKEGKWNEGYWQIDGNNISLTDTVGTVNLTYTNKQKNQLTTSKNRTFYENDLDAAKASMLFMFHQLANRSVMDENRSNKKYLVNSNGYGKGVIYKNFDLKAAIHYD